MKDKTVLVILVVSLVVVSTVVVANTNILQIMRGGTVNSYNTTATLISPGIGQSVSLPVTVKFNVYTEAPNPYYSIRFSYVINGQTYNYIEPHTALPQDGIVVYSFNPAGLYGKSVWVDWYVLMYNNNTRIWNNQDAHWSFSLNGGTPPPPPDYITMYYYLTNMFPSTYDTSSLPRASDFTGPVGYWYIDTDNDHVIYRYPNKVDGGTWTIDLNPSYDGGTIWKDNGAVTEMPYAVANKSIDVLYLSYINKLTVNTYGEGLFSLSPSAADNKYAFGMVVTITAMPVSGWIFDHWSGDASGSANPTTVTMDGDKNVTATFVEEQPGQYTLTLHANPPEGGTVSVISVASASQFPAGSAVTISAIPNNGYAFSHWSGSASGTSPTTTITMNGDMTITANFQKTHAQPSWLLIIGIIALVAVAIGAGAFIYKKR